MQKARRFKTRSRHKQQIVAKQRPRSATMSRTDRYSGEASGGKNKKHRKNKYKPKKNKYRDGKLPKKQVLRKETIYAPPKSSKPHRIGNQIEVHDPARPFTVLPCEACGAVV
jgi:hypothetical protein